MEDVLIRFLVGGLVVSFFSILQTYFGLRVSPDSLEPPLGRAREVDHTACRERICRI
jgi:hypothetical protein